MAYKRKGQLTVAGSWSKHLRKSWRRWFWKGEREAEKKLIRREWREAAEIRSEDTRNQ